MFKKILSLVLAVMMLMSVAVVMASAAEGDVAEAGAEGDVADTGLDPTTCLNFDNTTTNWAGPVRFYVYVPGEGELIAWGSKKLNGTDNGDGTWSYDPTDMGLVAGKQYAIIFQDAATGDQTYDLLFDTSCIGDTGYVTGNSIENPTDSTKTAKEARWKSSTSFGPALVVTSIGNVVGETCPANTTPYEMMVAFLKNTLDNARTYSGKDDQTLIDDTGKGLSLSKDEVEKAISESGVSGIGWDKSKSTLSGGTTPSSTTSSGTSSSTSSGTSSTAKTTGSASNTQTGQGETVLFIMLGVMVAAAGVIFFARKKERA